MKALPVVKGGTIVGEKNDCCVKYIYIYIYIYIICSKAENLKGYKQDQTENNTGHLGEGAKGIKSLFRVAINSEIIHLSCSSCTNFNSE